MALIKSKIGNTLYSWKSDDIRDAEINKLKEDLQSIHSEINIGPTSSIDINLISGATYTISASGNAWNGVALVQLSHTMSDFKYYSELIPVNNWKIDFISAPSIIRITNLDPSYGVAVTIAKL